MKSKMQTVIAIASEINYSNFFCSIPANINVTSENYGDGLCYQQTCSKCIFNGLGQPDNNILETLFKDIKNES